MSIKPQSFEAGMNSSADGAAGATGPGLSVFDAGSPALSFSAAATGGFAGPAFQAAVQSIGLFSAVSSAATPSVAAPATASATSGATGTTKSAAVATPAWMNTLATASIAADIKAADVNGTITYAGLETVVADLDSKLASGKTTLTTAEFTDLKTITANLNNGVSTSGYLSGVMNSLVNGSIHNATWTGGNATSVALGNLAVGSSATQLSELNGKWLQGTDLPSSQVNVEGQKFSVSYSTSSKPVFAASGPSVNDVNQGYLGDCYLEASLAEVACENPGDISSMFTNNGNNTYGVKFYVNGVATYETVNTSLADGGTVFNSGADIWASLAEKAYVALQSSSANANSFTTIGNGGAPEIALEAITGASQINDFEANGSSWYNVTYNSSFALTGYSSDSTAAVTAILKADLAKGDDLVLSSETNATSGGKITLVASHAMSIYGFDTVTGEFEIRNPWGTEPGQTWNTTFEVSLSTLLAAGDVITADNMGTKNAAPVVVAPTAAQTWKLGQAISFALPSNTFLDPQSSTMTYSAKLSNGAALPSWLSFNGTTGTFSGIVANSTAGLTINVTAADAAGLSTTETFSVLTPAPAAPTITAQTATQTWKLGQAVNFALASNTFTDPQGEKLSYSATLSNGTALPSWLTFNATSDTFSGTVPNTAAGLSIKVTATDLGGASSSETFSVLTPAAAPTVTAQTASQSWKTGSAVNFSLAAATFTDPQKEALTYTATQANGSALPAWLKFNGTTDTFSGTAPSTATTLSLKVTATDTSGLSVSETFAAAVAQLTQAISSLPGSGSVSSALTQLASVASPTLASPAH
jgi:hypothetical protein